MMHSHIKPVFFLSFSLCYDNLNKCSSLHVIKNCHWNLESIFVSSLGEPFPLFDRLKLGVQWDLKVGDTMRILTQVSIKSIFCVFFILSPCVFWQLMPILHVFSDFQKCNWNNMMNFLYFKVGHMKCLYCHSWQCHGIALVQHHEILQHCQLHLICFVWLTIWDSCIQKIGINHDNIHFG